MGGKWAWRYIGGKLAITHVFMVRKFEVVWDTLNDGGILLLKVT